ncbi:MAG: hypothetical protein ABI576_11980 [Flavobacterium sp.]
MKTVAIITILSGTILTAQQKQSIAATVTDTFKKEFPNTKVS